MRCSSVYNVLVVESQVVLCSCLMTDKAFLRIVVSFLVLHLVAAVGLLIMEATVKALETKVAQLEASLGKKNETASSSHGATSSSIVLADHSLRIKPETFFGCFGRKLAGVVAKI